jgi:predicted DsbA family dithiol-disulfide isomerase
MPFQLNSNTPDEGEDMMEHLLHKYGPEAIARYGKPGNPLDLAGAKVGVTFNPTRRVVQTMKSHQLMHFCDLNQPNKSAELMDILFRKYFEEALDISKVDVLVDAAVECGLDAEEARAVVISDKYRAEVIQNIRYAQNDLRVSGVPYVMIESAKKGKKPIAFSGAQGADIIQEQLEYVYNN